MVRFFTRTACNRRSRASRLSFMLVLAAMATTNPWGARGATLTWIKFGSGNFNGSGNWFPSAVPGPNDYVSFEVGSGNPYTVTFPGNDLAIGGGGGSGSGAANYSTRYLRIRDAGVTFDGSTQAFKGSSTYAVTSTDQGESNRSIIIGLFSGDNAQLNLNHSGIVCCGGFSSLSGVAATLGDGVNSSGALNVGYGQFNVTGSDFTQRQLIVGKHGAGAINVFNGADVNVTGFNSTTSLGRYADGSGAVDIGGLGSTWTSANNLWVGENGSGAVTVHDGGSLWTSGAGGDYSAILGVFAGSTGTANVTGVGSTWTNGTALRVGNSGDGQLVISNGGVLNHTVFYRPITIESPNGSSALVTGAGSQLNTPGTIYVGSTGKGSLAVLGGGHVTTGAATIRALNTGRGDILVAGQNSQLDVTAGALTIGLPEPGFAIAPATLTINTGGLVNVAHDIYLKNGGTIDLQDGTLAVEAIRDGDESTEEYRGFLNFAGGTLHATEIYGNVVNDGGTMAPGRTLLGRTEIFGNYVQDAAATLALDIGGTLATTLHDILVVGGDTKLGGLLELDLVNSFLPTAQQTFHVVESLTAIDGVFDNVANGERLATADGIGSFLVNYGADSQFGEFSVVLSDFQANAPSADFDGDGDVDGDDLAQWSAGFGKNGADALPSGGSNLNHVANGSDFLNWQRQYRGVAAPSAVTSTPEPTALLLCCLCVSGFGVRRIVLARRG
ncbi:MAG: hypothetical protein KDA44_08275 [Planctomycetales bacterium]|nr:hypothetical protein [Planctomycetales bacterium]